MRIAFIVLLVAYCAAIALEREGEGHLRADEMVEEGEQLALEAFADESKPHKGGAHRTRGSVTHGSDKPGGHGHKGGPGHKHKKHSGPKFKGVQCASANEGQQLALSCPEGQLIADVDFASYGTPGGGCPHALSASLCHSDTSKDVVESTCLQKNKCTVPVSNGAFTDPCPGAHKRLLVKVKCKPKNWAADTGIYTKVCGTANENGVVRLTCPKGGKVSSIEFASYGSPEGNCEAGWTKGKCHTDNAHKHAIARCLNKKSCDMPAQNGYLGDPCRGTKKVLSIEATCKEVDPVDKLVESVMCGGGKDDPKKAIDCA
jgi:hypothetical protein